MFRFHFIWNFVLLLLFIIFILFFCYSFVTLDILFFKSSYIHQYIFPSSYKSFWGAILFVNFIHMHFFLFLILLLFFIPSTSIRFLYYFWIFLFYYYKHYFFARLTFFPSSSANMLFAGDSTLFPKLQQKKIFFRKFKKQIYVAKKHKTRNYHF